MRNIPVILICYNRPVHTSKVLDSLRAHNIQNLIIFSDAPKTTADYEGVRQTRKLIRCISWTKPDIVYQEENKGLARSVVSAANYAIEKHECFILLEDDCVPQRYFFDFMYQCLDRYQDNDKVFGINGFTVPVSQTIRDQYPYDMYFYPRIGSWGWATWKRAWKHYDSDLLKLYETAMDQNVDLTQGGADIPGSIERYMTGSLKDVWTLHWVLATYIQKAFYIYPTVSHIENIGCDGTGVHCGKTSAFTTELAIHPPVRFPDDVVVNDCLIKNYNKIFGEPAISPAKKATAKLNTMPGDGQRLSIVHLNTHDVAGGAAKVARRLNDSQRKSGHEARMIVRIRTSDYPYSEAFDPAPDLYQSKKCRRDGLLDYEYQGSNALTRHPLVQSADILHLHNLHGNYFNPFSLSRLSQLKPTVWTLHDMQSITGHCAHSFDCDRWMLGCGNCPRLDASPAIEYDSTAKLWSDKKNIYSESSLNIVTPSNWLKNKVEKSILSNHPVEVIYNGIDTELFHPFNKQEIRSRYGIPENAFVLGSAAHSGALSNPWKGSSELMEVLDAVWAKFPEMFFLNIGGDFLSDRPGFVNTGHIDDESLLAQTYSCLDTFVYTTLADNCPLVVLEALATGIPIISFDVGGIPELVRDRVDGCLIKNRNLHAVVESIFTLMGNRDYMGCLSKSARESAEKSFDHTIISEKYNKLYLEVLENEKVSGKRVTNSVKVPYYRYGHELSLNPVSYFIHALQDRLGQEMTLADSIREGIEYFKWWLREQRN